MSEPEDPHFLAARDAYRADPPGAAEARDRLLARLRVERLPRRRRRAAEWLLRPWDVRTSPLAVSMAAMAVLGAAVAAAFWLLVAISRLHPAQPHGGAAPGRQENRGGPPARTAP